MKGKLPDFYLEQYLIGEATDDIARIIENDEEAKKRVRELEADNDNIFATYPPGWFADRVAEKVQTKHAPGWLEKMRRFPESVGRRLRHPLWVPLVPLVALSVLGALLLPRLLVEDTQPDQLARGERIKGMESQIVLYRSGVDGDVETLSDGGIVQAGDRLQISYRAAGA